MEKVSDKKIPQVIIYFLTEKGSCQVNLEGLAGDSHTHHALKRLM
jgi:hypothetical protein